MLSVSVVQCDMNFENMQDEEILVESVCQVDEFYLS